MGLYGLPELHLFALAGSGCVDDLALAFVLLGHGVVAQVGYDARDRPDGGFGGSGFERRRRGGHGWIMGRDVGLPAV